MDAKAITRPAAVPLPLLIYGSKNSKRRTLNVTGDPSNDDDSNWFSGEEQWASLSFGDSENFNATHFCQDCNYYDDFFAVGERSDGFIEDFQNSFTSDYKEEDDLAPFLAFVKIAPAHRRFQALGRRIRKRRKRKFPKIIERSWEDTPDEHFQSIGENVKQLSATSHKSVEKTIDKMSSIPLWYYAFSFAPVIFMLGIMIGSIFFGCGINLSGKSFDGDSSWGIPDLINESSAATTAA